MKKLIQVKDNLIIVDTEAEIKRDDLQYYCISTNNIHDISSHTDMISVNLYNNNYKIITTLKPTNNIPLILNTEEEIREMVRDSDIKKNWLTYSDLLTGTYQGLTVGKSISNRIGVQQAFISGYKSNPAKYTEEQVRKAVKDGIEQGLKWYWVDKFKENEVNDKITEILKASQLPIPKFEVEIETKDNGILITKII